MHSFARHRPGRVSKASTTETKGLVLKGGWRYDLMGWFHDTFSFRGKFRELRQRTATLARLQPGDAVLDVGCGTGTLAIEVQSRARPRIGRLLEDNPIHGRRDAVQCKRHHCRNGTEETHPMNLPISGPFRTEQFSQRSHSRISDETDAKR
jgi:hypothetical protein